MLDVSAVGVAVVSIAICDITRQEFSLCVYSQYVYAISVILLLFVQITQILQFSMINVLEIFGGVCSNLSPISSNVSSLRTWRRQSTFLFFTEPVSLNILACLLSVLGLGTGLPGNLLEICVVFQNTTFCFSYTYCENTHVHAMRFPV